MVHIAILNFQCPGVTRITSRRITIPTRSPLLPCHVVPCRAVHCTAICVQEVNPEFMAVLLPSVQEEVLSNHRLEQQGLADQV